MDAISRVGPQRLQMPLSARLTQNQASRANEEPTSFVGLLQSGITKVNTAQQDATSQVHQLMTGGDVSEVEVYTSVQKADMAFRMLDQVRNKLMQAYEEINAIRI